MKSQKEVTKQKESKLFLLFLLDDRRIVRTINIASVTLAERFLCRLCSVTRRVTSRTWRISSGPTGTGSGPGSWSTGSATSGSSTATRRRASYWPTPSPPPSRASSQSSSSPPVEVVEGHWAKRTLQPEHSVYIVQLVRGWSGKMSRTDKVSNLRFAVVCSSNMNR